MILYTRSLIFSVLFCVSMHTQAQFFISKELIVSYTKPQLDSMLDANGIPAGIIGTKYGISAYKVLYNTVSWDSSATFASGLMVVPQTDGCPVPMGVYAHGTIFPKDQAPSRMAGLEPFIGIILGSVGYVAILPDYLGLGDGPGLHPYQHKHTEATSIVDMARAAREQFGEIGINYNNQLFITGYSQGGHAAMAAMELIESKLSNEFQIGACAPMSGAYSLSGVMKDVMLSDDEYPEPSYLPYIVFGWNQIYQLFNNPSEVLASPYDSLLPPFFNGISTSTEINTVAPSVPKTIFRPAQIDSFQNDPNYPFRIALADNDVYKFKPQAPLRMFYCKSDSHVSFLNAIVAQAYFDSVGCQNCSYFDVDSTLDHVDCAQIAVLYAKNFFEPFVIRDSCYYISSITETYHTQKINAFWNGIDIVIEPVNASLSGHLRIFDLAGRLIVENPYFSGGNIPIPSNDIGLYHVNWMHQNGLFSKKIIVY